MKALLQRVKQASVDIDAECVAKIDNGLLILLGVEKQDDKQTVKQLARKVLKYRVFSDEQGKMNKSLVDVMGDLLIVSQFTLVADTQKGLRPGFSQGASPDQGEKLYESFVSECRTMSSDLLADGKSGLRVETGCFGADMQVSLINDGPVTFLLEV